MICVLGGRYNLFVLGMTRGSSRDVRATRGAEEKSRRVSLSTECTAGYIYQSSNAYKDTQDVSRKRTVIHIFEVLVGGCACETKSVDDFFPQTMTHIGVKSE
jgi:hypothetical protein